MDKEQERQLVNQILDYYEFLFRDDGQLFLSQTGTPSFHLLIKNKAKIAGNYQPIPHGKGKCSLTLGLESVDFVFDDLYDILMPYIGDEKGMELWTQKKNAEKEIEDKKKAFLNSKNIEFFEGVLDGQNQDMVMVLNEYQKDHFVEELKHREHIEEIFALEKNGEYLYIVPDQESVDPKLINIVVAKEYKSREDLDIITYDYYRFLDETVEAIQAMFEKKQFQSLPQPIQDLINE